MKHILLALLATTALAQTPPDQKTLLATTRHAYYLPLDRNVQGFSCTVALDWPAILEQATGKPVATRDKTLLELQAAQVAVTDDILKDATVTAHFSAAQPLPGAGTKQLILNHMIQAALAGWNPFLSDRIFPREGTRYHFESAPTGYRLTLDAQPLFSILTLDPQLRVTQGETHLNGVITHFTPHFDPSTHGWLLTALETITESAAQADPVSSSTAATPAATPDAVPDGATPTRTAFTYTYQFVGDMLVPKRVTVQVDAGAAVLFELKACTLVRPNATAESKAATQP